MKVRECNGESKNSVTRGGEAVDAGDGMAAHNVSSRIRKTSVSVGQGKQAEKKSRKVMVNIYYGVRFGVKKIPIEIIWNPQQGRPLRSGIQ